MPLGTFVRLRQTTPRHQLVIVHATIQQDPIGTHNQRELANNAGQRQDH